MIIIKINENSLLDFNINTKFTDKVGLSDEGWTVQTFLGSSKYSEQQFDSHHDAFGEYRRRMYNTIVRSL